MRQIPEWSYENKQTELRIDLTDELHVNQTRGKLDKIRGRRAMCEKPAYVQHCIPDMSLLNNVTSFSWL
jgi:hypothetical protein